MVSSESASPATAAPAGLCGRSARCDRLNYRPDVLKGGSSGAIKSSLKLRDKLSSMSYGLPSVSITCHAFMASMRLVYPGCPLRTVNGRSSPVH